MTCNGFQAHIR